MHYYIYLGVKKLLGFLCIIYVVLAQSHALIGKCFILWFLKLTGFVCQQCFFQCSFPIHNYWRMGIDSNGHCADKQGILYGLEYTMGRLVILLLQDWKSLQRSRHLKQRGYYASKFFILKKLVKSNTRYQYGGEPSEEKYRQYIVNRYQKTRKGQCAWQVLKLNIKIQLALADET